MGSTDSALLNTKTWYRNSDREAQQMTGYRKQGRVVYCCFIVQWVRGGLQEALSRSSIEAMQTCLEETVSVGGRRIPDLARRPWWPEQGQPEVRSHRAL